MGTIGGWIKFSSLSEPINASNSAVTADIASSNAIAPPVAIFRFVVVASSISYEIRRHLEVRCTIFNALASKSACFQRSLKDVLSDRQTMAPSCLKATISKIACGTNVMLASWCNG